MADHVYRRMTIRSRPLSDPNIFQPREGHDKMAAANGLFTGGASSGVFTDDPLRASTKEVEWSQGLMHTRIQQQWWE
jgi:hypothetical protein